MSSTGSCPVAWPRSPDPWHYLPSSSFQATSAEWVLTLTQRPPHIYCPSGSEHCEGTLRVRSRSLTRTPSHASKVSTRGGHPSRFSQTVVGCSRALQPGTRVCARSTGCQHLCAVPHTRCLPLPKFVVPTREAMHRLCLARCEDFSPPCHGARLQSCLLSLSTNAPQ